MTAGPASDPADARRVRLAKPAWGRLAGTVVGVVALVCLGVGAVHGARTTAALSNGTAVASGRLDIAYYDCLTTQAHSLIEPGQIVVLSMANPGNWATLGKVVTPWARVTRDTEHDTPVLSLEARSGPGSCLGSVVVAVPERDHATGHGCLAAGERPPPATPL